MGVPKFFRYTSERYPSLNELVKQFQIPEFDNMYLDMNGIIHNCSHPDDSNPHFRITEQKIFEDIFHYISILFQIIKPKKLFFMAIDGVAPRAKMNQQRGRRFRSAREAEILEERAKAKGETLPSEKRFDSNCITPGTVFMARLHEQLKYFVKKKISTDPLWSKCRVILSGHETPGEGEHKIMDYIRWARSQPDYEPNTRHCLYGLDADLIMLGMCTHEPHFALLREEVKFGKSTQRATSPEETNFYLLHLSLMRDYLEQEFLQVKDKLPFEWDLEKIVDDWVLMGFLVGNDFIPNLPNMHISNDALPLLYKTYMKVLPTLDGYINEMGNLNLGRFEMFMQELAKIDKEAFQETYADLRFFQEKTGRRPNANERKVYKPNDDDTFNVNVEDIKSGHNDDLQALISATDMLLNDMDDEDDEDYEDMSDEEVNFHNEFILHKKDYYMNKLDYAKVTPVVNCATLPEKVHIRTDLYPLGTAAAAIHPAVAVDNQSRQEVLASQAECYVRAIQWNLHYYYQGCASWCWYYPHHYAPYMSDIKGFQNLKIEFELGEPFKPFEQLLAVLPAASKALLPDPFHALMTEDASPIVEYYPVNFETDLNGKKNDWEAVVLIPFIDEKRLLSAMNPLYEELTPDETKRNTHGPMLVYNYTQHSLGSIPAPEYFPAIKDCHCSETRVWRNELDMPLERLRRGVLQGAHTTLYYPGFPTMKHLKYTTALKKNKCRVFDQPSRNDNMIVTLTRREDDPLLEAAARELLGRTVWVGWPHLTQAKVISVSNEKQRLNLVKDKKGAVNGDAHAVSFTAEFNVGNMHKQWLMERSTIVEHNLGRMGIDVGDINVIVHAVNLKGHKYVVQSNTSLAVENVWCEVPCGYAYQAVLKEVEHKSSGIRRNAAPQEVFPPGAGVFLMTGPYYGCLAQVVSAEDVGRSGRVKVLVSASEEPLTNATSAAHNSQYKLAHHVAATTGITTQLLSRMTGCILVLPGERNNLPTEQQNKFNIGLNLKFNKKNQEVSGYTRRCPTTNQWLYSSRCAELVAKYVETYPDVIQALSYSSGNDIFYEGELWPGQVGDGKPQEIVDWLKQQPHSSAGRRDCGAEALEPEEMLRLAESIDSQLAAFTQQEKRVTLQIKLGLLYMPNLHEGNISPDPKADFQLYDRVVCAARNLTVPIGAKGTITAIYRTGPANTVRLSDKLNSEPTYQILFDQAFAGGMTEELFTEYRFYRLSGCHLLNISFGRNLRERNGHVAQDNFQPQILANPANKPNRLRTNDGHHSAFASYSSPTKERQTPADNYQHPPPAVPTMDTQEKSTELLKSLLKISETYTAPARPKTSQENWRARSDTAAKQQEPPQQNARPQRQIRTQQQENWRSDNSSNIPVATIGQRVQPVWNPSLLHGNVPQFNKPNDPAQGVAVPPLPFPNFSQLPPPPQGFPYQLPPPPAGAPPRPPPFAHAHGTNKPPFPTHLPNLIAPSLAFNQQNEPPASTAAPPGTMAPSSVQEPTTPTAYNPFVPLQVVAKQRRNQNPSAATNKSNVDTASASITAPSDQQYSVPLQQNNQITNQGADSSKPRRKRKSRIAANLPIE